MKVSTSYNEVLKHFGLRNKGSNAKTLKERIQFEGIDDSHIRNRPKTLNANIFSRVPNEKLFCKDSAHRRNVVKRRILSEKLLDHKTCSICGSKNEWNGQELNMVFVEFYSM